MAETRNPYIVLGIDFGAGPAEAKRAFARVSLRLRRNPNAPFAVEDATSAEHRISEMTDPHSSIGIFRVPADPSAYEDVETVTMMNLEPRNLPRTTERSGTAAAALEAELIDQPLHAGLDALADELLGYIS